MKAWKLRYLMGGLFWAALAWPASGAISILVDEIHGRPLSGDLAAALPACEITALTRDDFPITELIASGTITLMETDLFFTVPPGAQTLYLAFEFSSTDLQLPFITLYGPDSGRIGGQCEGALHLETPEAGEYRLHYTTWVPMSASYKIGTGPPLFASGVLDDHDIVCNIWDDTMLMFRGELPPYSAIDEAAYLQYLESGGGFLYIREPLIEMALKPIINIYAAGQADCDLDLGFPGRLTFADPPCRTDPVTGGTWLHWQGLGVSPGRPVQILYEGKLGRQTDWLQLDTRGEPPLVSNRTDRTLLDINLIRHEGADRWSLAPLGALAGGQEAVPPTVDLLGGADLKAAIGNIIRTGGLQAGLFEGEIEEFLARYCWADRWLTEAFTAEGWCALYRVGTDAYDEHIACRIEPAAREKVRTMWIWATGLGENPTEAPASAQIWGPEIQVSESDVPIIYHEYGVQYQRGPAAVGRPDKDFTFLDWSFYDGAAVVDPSDNCGEPQCPWFTWTGGHPEAESFMAGVSVVLGHYPGTLTAPWSEQVLVGDADAATEDWVFPPGSSPPIVAAREVGDGRAATIHTMSILGEYQDNRTFLRNTVAWLARYPSPAPDIPPSGMRITSLRPNPFNPRLNVGFAVESSRRTVITVCDMAGKRLATLADEVFSAGEHEVVWNGQDDEGRNLPSGGYLIRLASEAGEQTGKVMLVR